MKIKNKILFFVILSLCYFAYTSCRIYDYSKEYSEVKSDVAIVLGAGTKNGIVSAIYRERINHGISLFNGGFVNHIILTGGKGRNEQLSDSRSAQIYAFRSGLPLDAILIEEKSNYTKENLIESKRIMDSLHYRTALIVSDPLHMKRSVDIALSYGISCRPSPTPTTMYRSRWPKVKSLIYETFFYCIGELIGRN